MAKLCVGALPDENPKRAVMRELESGHSMLHEKSPEHLSSGDLCLKDNAI